MAQKILTISAGGILTEVNDAKQEALSGTGFVKSTAGTISYDTATYLTTAGTAADSSKLGGVVAASYPQETDGTWTPTFNNLTVVGTPTYTGTYRIIGKVVFWTLTVSATTSTSATQGVTYFNLPTAALTPSTFNAINANGSVPLGGGFCDTPSYAFCPTWFSGADIRIILSGFYLTA